jgi:hypothetical protein
MFKIRPAAFDWHDGATMLACYASMRSHVVDRCNGPPT